MSNKLSIAIIANDETYTSLSLKRCLRSIINQPYMTKEPDIHLIASEHISQSQLTKDIHLSILSITVPTPNINKHFYPEKQLNDIENILEATYNHIEDHCLFISCSDFLDDNYLPENFDFGKDDVIIPETMIMEDTDVIKAYKLNTLFGSIRNVSTLKDNISVMEHTGSHRFRNNALLNRSSDKRNFYTLGRYYVGEDNTNLFEELPVGTLEGLTQEEVNFDMDYLRENNLLILYNINPNIDMSGNSLLENVNIIEEGDETLDGLFSGSYVMEDDNDNESNNQNEDSSNDNQDNDNGNDSWASDDNNGDVSSTPPDDNDNNPPPENNDNGDNQPPSDGDTSNTSDSTQNGDDEEGEEPYLAKVLNDKEKVDFIYKRHEDLLNKLQAFQMEFKNTYSIISSEYLEVRKSIDHFRSNTNELFLRTNNADDIKEYLEKEFSLVKEKITEILELTKKKKKKEGIILESLEQLNLEGFSYES